MALGGGVAVLGLDARGAPSGVGRVGVAVGETPDTVRAQVRSCVDGGEPVTATGRAGVLSRSGRAASENPATGEGVQVDGVVHVRHGARTAPARSADLGRFVTREGQQGAAREWLANVALVTQAPLGSQCVVHPAR